MIAHFSLSPGGTLEWRHDARLWGFGLLQSGDILVFDSAPDTEGFHFHQKWIVGDINNDGQIDFAFVNPNHHNEKEWKKGVDLYVAENVMSDLHIQKMIAVDPWYLTDKNSPRLAAG